MPEYLLILLGLFVVSFFLHKKFNWSYPGFGLLGINIGLAPIEDYIFFLVCNYFAIVIYKTVTKL